MKYAIIKCVNGSFAIESEWGDKEKAIARFHKVCESHWNASDVQKATIFLVNEHLIAESGYTETVIKVTKDDVNN